MKARKKKRPVTQEDRDDSLVNTPGFRAMIAESRASLATEDPVSADELLTEARARLRHERS